ncbi:helix-turn-helix transcriptional regulator [Vibrio sp. PP-XX7]
MSKKKEVGLRLKRFRETTGLSQRALADKCGWGASRIGNYEAGVRSIDLDDAEVIAAALEIKAQQLLFEEETDFQNNPVIEGNCRTARQYADLGQPYPTVRR